MPSSRALQRQQLQQDSPGPAWLLTIAKSNQCSGIQEVVASSCNSTTVSGSYLGEGCEVWTRPQGQCVALESFGTSIMEGWFDNATSIIFRCSSSL